jgi:Derlin-2/3
LQLSVLQLLLRSCSPRSQRQNYSSCHPIVVPRPPHSRYLDVYLFYIHPEAASLIMDFANNNNDPFPAAGQFPLEQWFYEMPLCTRTWTTAAVITSILVQCRIISPFNLFYSFRTVFHRAQYWRLLTSFFYFGPLSLDLIFHLFFLQRYSRLLEENSGRSPARFSWLLVFAGACMLCLAPVFSMAFLGTGLSSTLVYIWSRRNPDTLLSFLGILTFRAPWLPWVLMGFTYTIHGVIPKDELAGVVVGHSKLGSIGNHGCSLG